MTEHNVTRAEPEGEPRAVVEPATGSRLASLLYAWEGAKLQLDAAMAHEKDLSAAIKIELTNAAPGYNRIEVAGPVSVRLLGSTVHRLDTKRLRTEQPDTYATYLAPQTRWELRRIKGGEA